MIPLYISIALFLILVILLVGIAYLSYLQQIQRQNRNQQAMIQHLPRIIPPKNEEVVTDEPEITKPEISETVPETPIETIINPAPVHPEDTHPETHTPHAPQTDKKKKFLQNWLWGEILGR